MSDWTGAEIAEGLQSVFTSPNEADSSREAANVVDGLFAIARALNRVAAAIEQLPGSDNVSSVEEWRLTR